MSVADNNSQKLLFLFWVYFHFFLYFMIKASLLQILSDFLLLKKISTTKPLTNLRAFDKIE